MTKTSLVALASCGGSASSGPENGVVVDASMPCSTPGTSGAGPASCDAAVQDASDARDSNDASDAGRSTSDGPSPEAGPPPPSPAIASSYLINPAHTGAVEDSTLVPPLEQRWTYTFPGPVSYPLIADATLFVIAGPGVAGGGLSAFDARTGKLAWGPVDVGSGLRPFGTYGAAAYEGGRVFALSGDGLLQAFDAATGRREWATQLTGQTDFHAAPTAYRGIVYVSGAGDGGTVYAVEESAGGVLWSQRISGDNPIAVDDQRAFISFAGVEAFAFDRLTGSQQWHLQFLGTGAVNGGADALFKGVIYARDWNGSMALDESSGTPIAAFTSHPPPAFHGDLGFFVSGGGVHAASVSTRASAWTFAGDGNITSAPVVAGGNVYVGSTGGNLYALAEASGVVTWTENVGSPFAPPFPYAVSDPLAAMGAARGILAAPLGNRLVVYTSSASLDGGTEAGPLDAGGGGDAESDAAFPALDAGTVDGPDAPSTAMASAYLINPAHTGAVEDSTLVPPLKRLWTKRFADTVSYPLIVNGVVYVIVGWNAADAGLTAFDARSGVKLWGPVDIGEGFPFAGGHAYDNGRIFTVNGRGFVQAYDAQTGVLAWGRVITDQLHSSSPPTAYGGRVYFSGTYWGGTLYGVDEDNGSFLWSNPVVNGDWNSPSVSADGVFVSYGCAQTYAFTPTGSTLWHYDSGCEGGGGATAVLYGNRLYARDPTWNTIFDATSGKEIGKFAADPPPAFHGNLGFYVSGGTLQAINVVTQANAWTFAGDGLLVTAPVVAAGCVFVGSSGGNLYAIDETKGIQLWSDAVGSGFVGASPATGDLDPYASLGVAEGFLVAPAGSTLVVYGD